VALPIAHAAAGYLVHRAGRRSSGEAGGWRRALVFMVIGSLPDMDFLVGFVVGFPGMAHRGISHTVVAAVAFGLLAGAVARWRRHEPFGPTAVLFGSAYLSHLALDFFTVDTRPPAGLQLLWPFSSGYLVSPVTIFAEIYIDGRTRAAFLRTVLAWPTVVVLMRELVIAAVAIGAWHAVEWWRGRAASERLMTFDGGGEDLA
jgi:membrane-bound metal-dependent hydrolase YbcI (DUF457 family)